MKTEESTRKTRADVDAELKRAKESGERPNFIDWDLRGADLRYVDLGGVHLGGADLRGADLRGADLRYASLVGADGGADLDGVQWGFTIPVVENIDKRILEELKKKGRHLNMNDWHECETTHCRAGWAVHLAGKAGYELEANTSCYLAGRLIYEASRPGVPCPDFFVTDDEALKSLREDAERYTN